MRDLQFAKFYLNTILSSELPYLNDSNFPFTKVVSEVIRVLSLSDYMYAICSLLLLLCRGWNELEWKKQWRRKQLFLSLLFCITCKSWSNYSLVHQDKPLKNQPLQPFHFPAASQPALPGISSFGGLPRSSREIWKLLLHNFLPFHSFLSLLRPLQTKKMVTWFTEMY